MDKTSAYELTKHKRKVFAYTIGFTSISILLFFIGFLVYMISGYRVLRPNEIYFWLYFSSVVFMIVALGLLVRLLYIKKLLKDILNKSKEDLIQKMKDRKIKIKEELIKWNRRIDENEKIVDYGVILGDEYSNENLAKKKSNKE